MSMSYPCERLDQYKRINHLKPRWRNTPNPNRVMINDRQTCVFGAEVAGHSIVCKCRSATGGSGLRASNRVQEVRARIRHILLQVD